MWSNDTDAPPYSYDSTGEAAGVDIDISKKSLNKYGLPGHASKLEQSGSGASTFTTFFLSFNLKPPQ